MFEAKMVINRLNIEKDSMTISAAISCPFDIDVFSPKVKIVFECNGVDRRLPFLVSNYYHQKNSDTCIIVCEYTYRLDKVFFGDFPSLPISFRFELYYGDHEIKTIPYLVSSNVIVENPDWELDENYIEYECYSPDLDREPEELDFEDQMRTEISFYDVEFEYENCKIVVLRDDQRALDSESFAVRSKVIVPICRAVFSFVRTVLAILLFPYFVIDGLLAAMDFTVRRKATDYYNIPRNWYVQSKLNISSFIKTSLRKSKVLGNLREPLIWLLSLRYKRLCKSPVVKNRVTILSGRRDEISGNLEFVYNILKEDPNIEFEFLLFSDPAGHNKVRNIVKFFELYATSRVVLVDDYFRLLNVVPKREETKLIQLWHACGAFKTFGFTRMGKKGGPKQTDTNHRMYDYAIVSGQEIAKHYAEGFGIPESHVVATGVPRTDIFMSPSYAEKVRADFYEKHPQLKDKKIMLVAPTFRGNGQMSAYYPVNKLNLLDIYNSTGGEYALIVKLHPFCKERFDVPEELSDYIIDCSDDAELNDLLFVSDLVVTDYSSVVFEASLLDIPMLFYVFDLYEYISTRDFYYDFEGFVPGKIVFSEKELVEAIINKDFEHEKVAGFKTKFFDEFDGKSSERVAELVRSLLKD